MAEITRQIGVAFGSQATLGTMDPTIAALSGALTETNGIVLGDPSFGEGESGVAWGLERDFSDKADVAGSFTKQASDYVAEKLVEFSIAIPWKGRGTASPAADADHTPAAGIVALYRSLGFFGAGWGGGIGWIFTPGAALQISARLWESGLAWNIKDIFATRLQVKLTGGEIAVAQFDLAGVIDSFAAAAFPSFNYGNQGSLSAPPVQSLGHNWGISAALRGFAGGTLTVDTESEEIEDVNAAGGVRTRQAGREITFEGTIIADSGSASFERAELVRTTAPTELQTFTLGTPAGSVANAIRVRLITPELQAMKATKHGSALAWQAKLRAVSAVANGEAEIIYL